MNVTPERAGSLTNHPARDQHHAGRGRAPQPRPADLAESAPASRGAQVLAVGGLTGPDGMRRLLTRLAAVPGVLEVVADFGDVEITPVLIAFADVPRPSRALVKSAIRAEVLRCGLTIGRHPPVP